MSKIQINTHGRRNWTLEDKNAKVAFDVTDSSGKMDGFNGYLSEKETNPRRDAATWLDIEEMKSLRDWLNSVLDSDK